MTLLTNVASEERIGEDRRVRSRSRDNRERERSERDRNRGRDRKTLLDDGRPRVDDRSGPRGRQAFRRSRSRTPDGGRRSERTKRRRRESEYVSS